MMFSNWAAGCAGLESLAAAQSYAMPFLVAIGAFVLTFLLTAGVNRFGLLRWCAAENAHWTERARILYPVRRSAALNIWIIPVLCGVAESSFYSTGGPTWRVFLVVVASWLGAILGTYPFDKKIFPQFSFGGWLRFVLIIWILRLGTLGLLVLAAVTMPDEFGWTGLVIAVAFLAFLIALNYGLWIQLGAKLGLFQRAKDSEQIGRIVRGVSEQMQIPCHTIWKMRSPVGYAAAMVMTRDLIFSDGLLERHPEDEIAAITAHELAHLNEPRNVHRTRLFTSLSWYPLIFVRPAIHLFGGIGVAALWLAPVLFSVYGRKLARRMEVRADSVASTNENTGVYARALERLYRENHMPAVMSSKRRVHPDLYDRLLAAGITPDYPRPNAPRSFDWSTGLVFLLFFLFLMAFIAFKVCVTTPVPDYSQQAQKGKFPREELG